MAKSTGRRKGSRYSNSLRSHTGSSTSKRGMYLSSKTQTLQKYESSYELRRFKALDASSIVKTWTRDHGIVIPYRIKKRRRSYHPDLMIEFTDGRRVLEEVKGYVWNKRSFAAKNIAALLATSVIENLTFRVIFGDMLDVVE